MLLLSPISAAAGTVLIEDMTWPEVRAAIAGGKTTAIYYAGSTEQNGPHMVIGKHNFIAHYTAQRIAEDLGNALVYPVMPFAVTGDPVRKTGHMRFPGSVTVSEDTFGAVAKDCVVSAIAAGFTTVVLMGDHGGGQKTLQKVASELNAEWSAKGIRVLYVPDVYYKSQEQITEYLKSHKLSVGSHAGMSDTSQVMFLDKTGKWIRKDKLAPGDAALGVDGDPRAATAELGSIFIGIKVRNAVAQIRELASRSR